MDWKKLGTEVASLRNSSGGGFFSLSTDRKILSELTFYAKTFPRTYVFNLSKTPN